MTEQEQIERLKKQLFHERSEKHTAQCGLKSAILELCDYCQAADKDHKQCDDCDKCQWQELYEKVKHVSLNVAW
jgi:hypothetical protein